MKAKKEPRSKRVASNDGLGVNAADEPDMFTSGKKPVHAKACRKHDCMMCCKCWCHFEDD